jgi:transposase
MTTAGAAQMRRDDQRLGIARRGLGVARVSESAADWRPARICADPYTNGETEREQGISRAGNARLQAISIQLAWNWVRW